MTKLWDAIDDAVSARMPSVASDQYIGINDNLKNLVSGLGTDKDKASHGRFTGEWLDKAELDAMYTSDWLAGTIVDAPADDMCREWRSWKGGPNQVSAMNRAERDLGVRDAVNRALKQSRLYGGSAILIGTGDKDPSKPLNMRTIRKGGIKYLHVLSRWEIASGPPDWDVTTPNFGKPTHYTLATPDATGVEIHPSRVVVFTGQARLELTRQFDGWGLSVLQRAYDAVRNVAATAAGLASLVQEAKIDVIQIEGLTKNSLDQGYRDRMIARFSLVNRAKSINGMLMLDSGETYEQKKINLADLPKVMTSFHEVAAGAAGMPMTRLLGRSASGLNASGDSDIRHYYDTLSARQHTELGPALQHLDSALKRHATGADSESLVYAWVPLWQMSEAERAAIALQRAQAMQVIVATNTVPMAAISLAYQGLLVENGTYPTLASELTMLAETGEVSQPKLVPEPLPAPPADGSKPTNPHVTTKAEPLSDAA